MIDYEIKKVSDNHCNVFFYKESKKRNGTIERVIKDKIYSTHFNNALNLIAHRKTQDELDGKNVSLKTYLSSFYKNWNNENC